MLFKKILEDVILKLKKMVRRRQMRVSTNNIEVKKINKNRVFRYIGQQEKISKPEIATALSISGPTVLQLVKELVGQGLVKEVGELKSTGGRKATAVAIKEDAFFAIGLDVTRNHIGLVVSNLSKRILAHVRISKPFVMKEVYFEEVGEAVSAFIKENEIAPEKILGVGISIPGIVNGDGTDISYSHMLKVSHVSCEKFSAHIPYPCTLLNDANAAGVTELLNAREYNRIIYLSLSNSVGGAIIMEQIYSGNNWRSGEFGHMTMVKDGEPCYCGKKGCFDAYCSALRLVDIAGGRLDDFFRGLDEGNKTYEEVWDKYIYYLVMMVENLHMVFDCDVVLGGYVGGFMGPYLVKFREKIAGNNIFETNGDYVKECKYKVEASALGAALHYIEEYIQEI